MTYSLINSGTFYMHVTDHLVALITHLYMRSSSIFNAFLFLAQMLLSTKRMACAYSAGRECFGSTDVVAF